MAFDTSYAVIYRNPYLADPVLKADTTAFRKGVRLIDLNAGFTVKSKNSS